MTIKLCLRPESGRLKQNNGIGRVLYAQLRDLPSRGFEFVGEGEADLYIGHTQQFNMPRIDAMICHGLYWTGDPGSGEYGGYNQAANRLIIDAARKARVVTTPSEWVAMPFKRDMRINPVVIGHGIDLAEWQIGRPKGYALWNKNRVFDVCNPIAAYELAKRGVRVMSTFAPNKLQKPQMMEVIGLQDSDAMKEIIAGASVYLSTTKETWGIGTVEAMACGVPVLGWNYGGTAELVTNGVEGVLVRPGDHDALYAGYQEIMANRERYSIAARKKAEQYDWSTAMDQYADLFRQLYQAVRDEPRGISVVITNHNYGRYVTQAIDSALNQTRKPDEVIVVDDGSTDNTLERLAAYNGKVRVITQSNQGVAAARTVGIEESKHPYITLLDADDVLEPTFLEVCHAEIVKERDMGICYTGLVGFDDQGHEMKTDFPPPFTWQHQAQNTNPPANCIPSACLFRREMWLRAGPHKQEYAPGEDAEFWTRGLSVGFRAKKVTADRLFRYRIHTGSATRTKTYKPIDDRLPWLRDHRFPMAVPMDDAHVPEVRSYSEPMISVVIAVTPGHTGKLANAIDSVLGQTLREWELIVIDDTFDRQSLTTQIDPLVIRRYPFVNWCAGDGKTLADARNRGIAESRAPLIVALDSKDELLPDALHKLLIGYAESEGRFVYGDTYIIKRGDKERIKFKAWPSLVQDKTQYARVAALIPRDWLIAVGGWSEAAKDDNDLYVRLARQGYCGYHIDRASLVQANLNGHRRGYEVTTLEANAMGSCCGGNAESIMEAKRMLANMPRDLNTYSGDPVAGSVRMEYTGMNVGSYTYNGRAGRTYRGGNNDTERFALVHPDDVEILSRTTFWKPAPLPPAAPPINPTPAIAPEPMLQAQAVIMAEPMIEAAPEVEITGRKLKRSKGK